MTKIFNKRNVISLLSIVVIALGLFTSYRESFQLWYVDSDVAVVSMVAQAINEHGFSFLRTFHFPVDNWLFSLILPLRFLLMFLHTGPYQILLMGVLIFWISAFFLAVIVAVQVGVKRALWSMGLVLCASRISIGKGGFLTYPVAHNVSMMWGFCALLFSLIYLRKGSIFTLLFSFVLFYLSTFSDPWMLPVFILPVICSAGLLYFQVPRKEKGRYLVILFMAFCVTLLCKVKFLEFLKLEHVLSFYFTVLRFSTTSLLNMFGAISYYFNVIPIYNFNNYYAVLRMKEHTEIVLFVVGMVVNFLIFSCVLIRLFCFVCVSCKSFKKDTLFLVSVIFFSILGIVASIFLFGGMPSIQQSRYIVNIYYMFIMLVCVLPYEKMSLWLRSGLFLYGVFWLFSSLVSNQSAWRNVENAGGNTNDIIDVLEQEHIQYAFGDYWGVDANALTWKTHETVKVRPFLYNQDYRGFLPTIWSSPSWYRLPPHQKWAFVVAALADDKTCTPYPSCREAVIHQFGSPLEIKEEKRFTFLIYDSDKAYLPADLDVDHWSTPIELPIKTLPHWKMFDPNEDMNGGDLVTDISDWYAVSRGKQASRGRIARVVLPVITARPSVAEMWMHLSSAGAEVRDVDVLYKGRVVAQWRLPNQEAVHYLEVPVEAGQQSLELEFSIVNPTPGKHGSLRGIRLHGVQMITQDGIW